VIKRILKTKFVREEYEKLHEIKDKEKHVKDIQKDKRDQRRTLKRKRPVGALSSTHDLSSSRLIYL